MLYNIVHVCIPHMIALYLGAKHNFSEGPHYSYPLYTVESAAIMEDILTTLCNGLNLNFEYNRSTFYLFRLVNISFGLVRVATVL